MSVGNDVRDGADRPAVDEYRQQLHERAVATGQQTAEAEEPRGAEQHQRGRDQGDEQAAEAPPVQQVCPATFGNSDIFGSSSAPLTGRVAS